MFIADVRKRIHRDDLTSDLEAHSRASDADDPEVAIIVALHAELSRAGRPPVNLGDVRVCRSGQYLQLADGSGDSDTEIWHVLTAGEPPPTALDSRAAWSAYLAEECRQGRLFMAFVENLSN